MSKYPIVSIITPTYNHEKYIGKCIESVLNQTLTNWEMIIINDGSKDDTEEIVLQYSDPRIRYFKQDNIGPTKLDVTYNKALSLCRGDLIAILEGDDFWPPKKLEEQIKAFSDPEVIFSHGRFKLYYERTNGCIMREGIRREVSSILNNKPIGNILFDIFDDLVPRAVTVMIRKSALEKIGGFRMSGKLLSVDLATFLELALQGKFKYVNSNLGFWRRHYDAITFKNLELFIMETINYCLEYLSFNKDRINELGLPIELLEKRLLKRKRNMKGIFYITYSKELLDTSSKNNALCYFKNIFIKGINEKYILYILISVVGFTSICININILEYIIKLYWRLF
jgi:glycosyltransferase involved in cell wall biosynthesis